MNSITQNHQDEELLSKKMQVFFRRYQVSRILRADTDDLFDIDDLPEDYISVFGKPDVVGKNYEIAIRDLIEDQDYYDDVISYLADDTFPLVVEYHTVRDYLKIIREKHSSHGDDLFDLF